MRELTDLPAGVEHLRSLLSAPERLNDVLDALDPYLPGQSGNSTRKNNRSGIRHYLAWAQTYNRSVLYPDPSTGRDYLAHLKRQHDQHASTIQNRITHARNFYRALHQLGHSLPDPFSLLELPRYDPAAHRDLYSAQELERMLGHADTGGKALILLGAHAGLTTREVLSLRWSDIRLRNDTLSIKKRLVEEPAELLSALRALAMSRGVLHDVRAPTLFHSSDQERLFDFADDNELRSALYRLCAHANVNALMPGTKYARGWRALRNNAGLRILELTADPELVQERLGLGTLQAVQPLVEKRRRLQQQNTHT